MSSCIWQYYAPVAAWKEVIGIWQYDNSSSSWKEVIGIWQYSTSDTAWKPICTSQNVGKGYNLGGLQTNPSSGAGNSAVTNMYSNIIDGVNLSDDSYYLSNNTLSNGIAYHASSYSEINGYIAGGYDGSIYVAGMDKLIFNVESVNHISINLSSYRAGLTGTQSISEGKGIYISGDTDITNSSTETNIIDGIVFSSDTAFTSTVTMSYSSYYPTSVTSGSNAYIAGGYCNAANNDKDTISEYIFSSDSISTLTEILSYNQSKQGRAFSTTDGYYICGVNPLDYNHIDKLNFSSLAITDLGSVLPTKYHETPSDFSSSLAGYITGGINYEGDATTNNTEKLLFSTDSVNTILTRLESYRVRFCGVVYLSGLQTIGPDYGYIFSGGYVGSTSVDKINFSTNGTSVSSMNATLERAYGASFNSYYYGYAASGHQNQTSTPYTYVTSIEAVDFNSETKSTLSNTSFSLYDAVGCNSMDNGYIFGGISQANENSEAPINQIRKYPFPDCSESTISNTLSTSIARSSGVNSSTSGYILGGYDGTNETSDLQKFSFSSESISFTSNVLSANTQWSPGVNSEFKGYISHVSNTDVDKLIFSNDSISTDSSVLPYTVYHASGINSQNTGYYCGGANNKTSIVLIDFDSDSYTTSSYTLIYDRGDSIGVNRQLHGTHSTTSSDPSSGSGSDSGSPTFNSAYTFTGFSSDSGGATAAENMTFSNYTISIVSTTTISVYDSACVTDGNYAIVAGGHDGVHACNTVRKYNYNNNFSDSLASNTLPSTSIWGTSVYSDNYGYFMKGSNSENDKTASGLLTYIYKYNFSNETFTSLSDASNSQAYDAGGIFNSSAGYVLGGAINSALISDGTKVEFSSDIVSSISNVLTSGKEEIQNSGVNSSDNGYILGGYDGSSILKTINKFAFSSETGSSLTEQLDQVMGPAQSASSDTEGYLLGGNNGPISSDGTYSLNVIARFIFSSEAADELSQTLTYHRDYGVGIEGVI